MPASRFAGEAASASREAPPQSADPVVAATYAREHAVREKFVDIETAKVLRGRLRECYVREGVNHLQNCRELAAAYVTSLKGTGFNVINWNNQ